MTFLDFASERGLIVDRLVAGRITRCNTENHPRSNNGAFLFCGEWGWIQDWAIHSEPVYWFDGKPRTPFEQADMQKRIEESRKLYAKERSRKQLDAANKAKWILGKCSLERHPYLERKGFRDMRANVYIRNDVPLLVIPMYCGELCGCQLIDAEGNKKFLSGQRTNDAAFVIGQGGRQFITEGFASAMSLQAILAAMSVTATIYATFSVGNAARLAKRLPNAFLVCDHDASGTGVKYAIDMGRKHYLPAKEGDDINDEFVKYGLFKCVQQLRRAL